MRKETILLITTFHSADRIWIIWNFLEKSFRTVYMNDFVCSLLFVHLPKWVLGFRWVVVWTGTWGLVYLLGKVYPLSRWYIPQGMFATLLIFHMLSFPMFVLYSFSSSLGIVLCWLLQEMHSDYYCSTARSISATIANIYPNHWVDRTGRNWILVCCLGRFWGQNYYFWCI